MSNIVNFMPARNFMRLVTETLSLMNPETAKHQQEVGYLSYQLAKQLKLPSAIAFLTMQAGLLHDIGGTVKGMEVTVADIEEDQESVARASAELLSDMIAMKPVAETIRHSQRPYKKKVAGIFKVASQPITSQIVHIADAAALMLDKDRPALNQVEDILLALKPYVGTEFSPKAYKALTALKDQDQVWLNLVYRPENLAVDMIDDRFASLDEATMITRFVSKLIDFRSPFTARHSAGVAASAKALAGFSGMSKDECQKIEMAGHLHDLGKLRTPHEVLEKPGKLTMPEFNVIKEHAYFTYETLKRIPGLEQIAEWAGFHHEKINGSGYPYGLKGDEIPFGAKILAVADIFSAITEDRPYRKGMPKEKILSILRENAANGEISEALVELLIEHYDEINESRQIASMEAGKNYEATMINPREILRRGGRRK